MWILKNRIHLYLAFITLSAVLAYSCKSSSHTDTSFISEVRPPDVPYDSSYFQGKWGGYLNREVYDFPLAIELQSDRLVLDIPAIGIVEQSFTDVSYSEELVTITADDQEIHISPAGKGSIFIDVPFEGGSRATLIRGKERPKLKRPQSLDLSDAYESKEVVFYNAEDDVELSGTLSKPTDISSAVIFLSGSGPSDRDETIFGHKPFAVIADHLSSHGVAVLRYDDRGVGESGGSQVGSTSYDFAHDAKAAYEFVQDSLGEIPIGFLGHSEGGMIAQIADSLVNGASFHIYLAGPGLDVIDLMIEQNRLFFGTQIGQEQADIYASGLQKVFGAVIEEGELKNKQAKINQLAKALYNSLDPDQARKIAPNDMFYAMNMNALQSNEWMLYFLRYQPRQYLSQINCPILALNGSKDIQVVPANLDAIVASATQAEVTAHELPDLNHLMQKCITGQVKEYALISETIYPPVLDTLVSWMSERGWAE